MSDKVKAPGLYATWEYDQFPYVLCGKVLAICERGLVEVEGYTGYRFMPLLLLPEKEGLEFKDFLEELDRRHDKECKELEEKFREELRDGLGRYGFLRPRAPLFERGPGC